MKNIYRLLRFSHWIKNIFVFIPLVFSHMLFDEVYLGKTILAFFTFSLTSSIIYIINDIADKEKDALHPEKKHRPLASGALSVSLAFFILGIVLAVLVPLLFFVNLNFILILAAYAVINILYSFYLKRIVILDIMIISAGFMLRVIGGALVISVYISSWLILTTLFLSLFLAVMKRKSEMDLMLNGNNTRKVLKDYTGEFINQISAISAAGVIICYALYTVSPRTIEVFGTENLVFTSVFFIFGVFRYMYLIYAGKSGENTMSLLIKDIPMIVNGLLYSLTILLIIYF